MEGKTRTMDMLYRLYKSAGLKVSVVKSFFDKGPTKDNITIREYITELAKNNMDVMIIKLTHSSLLYDLFEEIKFDILIYTAGLEENRLATISGQNLFCTLTKDDYVIINADDLGIHEFLRGNKAKVITYGLNHKASVTASSIQDGDTLQTVQCCIQRIIPTLEGRELVPQEFPITVYIDEDQDVYCALAAVTAALINDVDIGSVETSSL